MCGFTNENFAAVEALVTLKGSDTYDFVVVDDFNFIRSYDPKTVGGLDFQTLVCWQLVAACGKYSDWEADK